MTNKAYYLRKNHISSIPSRWVVLHSETRGEELDGLEYHTAVFSWTYYQESDGRGGIKDGVWEYHPSSSQLHQYLFDLAREGETLLVVSENPAREIWSTGLAEVLHFGGWTVKRLYHHHQKTIMTFYQGKRGLKFCSIHNWIPGSWESWAKSLGEDLTWPLPEEGETDEERQRVLLQARTVHRLFHSYLCFVLDHDLGGFASTISGQAMRAYRHRFMPGKILHYDDEDYNRFVRSGYHGGRCECFFVGKWTDRAVVRLDVNSMYPHVMREEKYPVRIRQWVKSPSLSWLERRLKEGCVMARVKLETEEPVYPKTLNEELCFPLGRFTATLCSSSLAYALEHGHIKEVEQAISFHSESIFAEYVDYFYTLKLDYEEGGDRVWRHLAKAFLNHLYGKFGEQYAQEIANEEDSSGEFYRRSIAFIVDESGDYKRCPYRSAWDRQYEPGQMVPGIEWSAFGRYVCTAGFVEGTYSAPAIAAHVTDYARVELYKALVRVGLDRVYYCDTDSMVIPHIDLPKMEELRSERKLGKWKVDLVAGDGEILSCKHYRLGKTSYQAGLVSDAVEYSPGEWSYALAPGLYSLLRANSFRGYPVSSGGRSNSGQYTKGLVGPDGRVTPHTLKEF